MPAKYKVFYILLFALIVFTTATSWAAVVKKFSLEDLSLVADKIVLGDVVRVYSKVDPEDGRVYTYNIIKPVEAVKGKCGNEIVVRQFGGSRGDLAIWVPGTPRFREGEKVLLFLKKSGKGKNMYFLRGMGQGFFKVETVNGKEIAIQKTENLGAVKMSRSSSARNAVEKIEPIRLPLKELIARIKKYAANQ